MSRRTYNPQFVPANPAHETAAPTSGKANGVCYHPAATRNLSQSTNWLIAKDEIRQPVCGCRDRPLLKTLKGANDGEYDTNYRCNHLPKQLDKFLLNTRRSAHQQWPTIRVYFFQESLCRNGDHPVIKNRISLLVQWPSSTAQHHYCFNTTQLRLET